MLPLPPAEVTQSEKTLSKEKSQVLETAIIHWTKQIKNVLKMDPENALKNGNNPGPLAEIDFWEKQALNLDSIYDQLNTERIKKVLKFLEQNKSTFISPFSKLQKEVQIARLEANENKKYLQTLRDLFESLNSGTLELAEMQELFIPIMHTILMIYTYSSHYNTTPRLVVLIREICNEIIKQCRGQVSGP
jgi:dynein heavy chain